MALSAVVLALAASLAIAFGLYLYEDYAHDLEAPEELSVNHPYAGARLYDRNGEFLYEFVDELNGLRRPVEYSAISPKLIAATVATEDSSFFQNAGINVKGLGRAAWENFNPFSQGDILEGSGGSSISQQLAKNLYIPADERADRSIDRKLREAVYAVELTRQYSKEQILTWYLNQINYGGIFYGVEAAAEGYFGKSANELTLAEAALLAGIPQSPNAYDPLTRPEAAKERRNQVLELMREQRTISIGEGQTVTFTDAEIDAAKAEDVVLAPPEVTLNAPHFIFSQVLPQLEALFGHDALLEDGLIVTTSIDMSLQTKAQEVMEQWIAEFEATSDTHNGAAIVIDPNTGEILTYLGSRDYYRDDIGGKNDNLVALNSPGSSFKPFVYLTAFTELGWSPGTMVLDQKTRYVEEDGTVFEPENPTHRFHGPITLRDALGNSLNIPAFLTAEAVGVDKVEANARRFGFHILDRQYGPSIAIGGVDLTAVDLAYGYAMLANGGVMRGVSPDPNAPDDVVPVSVLKVRNGKGDELYNSHDHATEKRVVDDAHAFMVTSILADPRAQCLTFGCGGVSVPGHTVAVKTGTSEPFDPLGSDAEKIGETWAFGYTRDLVVGIWAGNADNSPIRNIFSTSIAFHAMRDIMLDAYDGREQTPFVQPESLAVSGSCSRAGIAIGCRPDLVLKAGAPRLSGAAGCDSAPPRPGEGAPSTTATTPPVAGTPGAEVRCEAHVAGTPNATGSPTPGAGEACRDGAVPPAGASCEAAASPTAASVPQSVQPTAAPPPPQSAGIQGGGQIVSEITSPTGGTITSARQVVGRVDSPSLASYTLQLQGPDGAWQTLASGTQPVSGVLALLESSRLAPGSYTLALTVTDRRLGSASDVVVVNIR